MPPLHMTAQESDDGDSQEATDAGSPERRLGEVVKQTEIVLDQLEGERHHAERAEELEEGVRYLIEDNIRWQYRDILMERFYELASAVEDGDDPIRPLWLLQARMDETLDLITRDLDKAGFLERDSPEYTLATFCPSLARYAVAAAGGPAFYSSTTDPDPSHSLKHAMRTYKEIGELLG